MTDNKLIALSIVLLHMFMLSSSWLHAATISGTVQESDGTPLTGENYISVRLFMNDPCSLDSIFGESKYVSTDDGSYSITDLPAGTYFIQALHDLPGHIMYTHNTYKYAAAFWGSESSPRNCEAAEPVQLAAEGTLTEANIRLNRLAKVSGSIFEEDGVTQIPTFQGYIMLKEAKCDTDPFVNTPNKIGMSIQSPFTIPWVLPGTYYLLASPEGNFTHQWWTSTGSTEECSEAEPFTIAWGDALTGKDIQISAGATISGTVYRRLGNIPLTGTTVKISAYHSTSCEELVEKKYAFVDKSTGTYEVVGLSAGDYLLRARVIEYPTLYAWWATASSADECVQASPIPLSHQQSMAGKDFHLMVRGDVNDDFQITIADPITVLQILSGMMPTPVNMGADIDKDGVIGIAEAIYLLQDIAYRR